MARRRDHAAVYARRKERAIEAGYKSLRQQTVMRREGRPLRRDVGAYRAAKVRQTPAGTITKTATRAGLKRAVSDAAARGDRVSVIATFDAGSGPKTHRLDGRATLVPPASKVRKGTGDGPSSGETDGPLGAVQVVAGAAVEAGGGGGYDAGALLAYFDMYDDVFDALYDLWEEEYL